VPIAVRSTAWWSEPKGAVHDAVQRIWAIVRDESTWQYDADEYHLGLYAGAVGDLTLTRASRRGYTYGPCTLPDNICRSAVDTLVAKVAKHRPLPQVLASRGSWSDQQRARKMSQFLEGQFRAAKLFEKHAKLVVRDAAIFSRGLLYVWHEHGHVVVERTFPWEVFVDPWDAYYGDPRTIYRIRSMDRRVACALYGRTADGNARPKIVDAIMQAGRLDIRKPIEGTDTVDRVEVLEAWRRASGPEENDGRHVVVVAGATLVDEDWHHDFFPFARLHYNDPVTGYDGQGLVEQLEGYQYDINMMSTSISESYRLLGHTLVLVPDSAQIQDTEFRAGIGYVVRHAPGGTPQVFQPNPVHPAVYQRLNDLATSALNNVGISQMSATSSTPAHLSAAVAIQAVDDIETERFVVFGRSYESWCLDVARLMIAANIEIAEQEGEHAVKVPMRGTLLDLRWSDVVLDEFELSVFSSSLLPQSPAGRLDKLKMLWDAELIDRATFLRQLDAPDLAAELDLETADQMLADEQIEFLLEAPEDTPADRIANVLPIPEMSLAWCIRRAKQKTCRATLDGAPEYVLARLRQYTATAIEMQALANPPPPPPPDAGAPLPAPPAAPPLPEGPPLQ
jgi:hypothetical protein